LRRTAEFQRISRRSFQGLPLHLRLPDEKPFPSRPYESLSKEEAKLRLKDAPEGTGFSDLFWFSEDIHFP